MEFVDQLLHGKVSARGDEDTQHVRVVAENPVAQPADDDTLALMSQFTDGTALVHIDGIVLRGGHRGGYTAIGKYQLPQAAGGEILLGLGHKVGRVAHLPGRLVYNLPVVTGAAQPVGNSLAHGIAPTAIHAGDGDDAVAAPLVGSHNRSCLPFGAWLCDYSESRQSFDKIKHRHTLKEVGDVAEGKYDWKINSKLYKLTRG